MGLQVRRQERGPRGVLFFPLTPYPHTYSINDAIEQMREKFKHDTGQLAPVWRPNSTASACTCCGKKFSWTFRKHHCRNCGIVVCDNCSGSRYEDRQKEGLRILDTNISP